MKKRILKNVGDTVIFIGRFDPRQVRIVSSTGANVDFSYSDGATIQGLRPDTVKEKTKTVIEKTNPEL